MLQSILIATGFYTSEVIYLYYNKVEICGIDTSKLKLLKESEKTELLLKSRNGDKNAREELINGNLRLVLSVIQRFSQRGENLDDLFQVGCIGLIKSIDNFDLNQNVRFSTYAVPMIIGEIRRYLRDYNPIRVSRSVRDTAYHAMQIKEKIIAETQREPSVEEIAGIMGVKRETVVLALEAIVEPISIYEPVYYDAGDTIYVMDQIGDRHSDVDWIDEILLKKAINNLPEREKKILSLRFMNGMTQTEVASEIGISQAQVSRLEKGALDKIKGHRKVII
ncbi:MAG: RNA polymerase sporulation sigma factor SigG [Clostridia bacterium]|nr:RNA polymerase sporulation sigma factor SigG [Clostridia bacterium]